MTENIANFQGVPQTFDQDYSGSDLKNSIKS